MWFCVGAGWADTPVLSFRSAEGQEGYHDSGRALAEGMAGFNGMDGKAAP